MADYMNPQERLRQINKVSMAANLTATTEHLTQERLSQAEHIQNAEGTEDYQNLKQLRDSLVEQMLVVSESQEALREAYPSLVGEAEAKQAQLTRDSRRSGKDKVKNDFTGRKKRAARRKLQQIDQQRQQYQQMKDSGEQNINQQFLKNRFDRLERLKEGSDASGPLATKVTNSFNSSVQVRRSKAMAEDYSRSLENCHGEPVEFAGPEYKNHKATKLRGNKFEPTKWNQKVVILYSGSGDPGSGEAGVGTTIANYVSAGYMVYQVDYRGYGQSGADLEGGGFEEHALTEKRFYEDGDAILNGVMNDSGVKMNKIIMHGYSMGGAIASHVAAKHAEEYARKEANGEPVSEEDQLGGIVMDSPMVSLKFAAGDYVSPVFASAASWAAGAYSAEDHLGILYQHRPDIPILFVSGDNQAAEVDGLRLDATKIHQKYRFTNSTSKIKSNSPHMDCHIDKEMIKSKFGA